MAFMLICSGDSLPPQAARGHAEIMKTLQAARDSLPDHEQKQVALDLLEEAWVEARLHGVDGDCMAQVCLFAAFSELVSTYGEDATARYAESLPKRITNGEFSIELSRQ